MVSVTLFDAERKGNVRIREGALLPAFDYPPGEARLVEAKSGQLTIPTYVAANDHVVHPSVLYVPGGWNGYPFWMAMTPYSNADSTTENPSIVCSADGLTWAVPSGVTNPLVPHLGGANYNSDPYLFLTPDNLMCIYWRQIVGTASVLKYITSTDGVTWSAQARSLSTVRASEDLLSPSIIWEQENSQYRLYAHDNAITGQVIVTATASSLAGPWSSRTQVTYSYPPGETETWHSEFRRSDGGFVVGLITSGNSGGGKLYAVRFSSPTVLEFGNRIIERGGADPHVYKCSFVPTGNTWRCWFNFITVPTWGVEHGTVAFDYTSYWDARRSRLASLAQATLPAVGGGLLWDSFDRSDGAVGTSTSGTAWTTESGQINVASNVATGNSADNNKIYFDASTADVDISAQYPSLAVNPSAYLTYRRTDNNNFYRAKIGAGHVRIEKIVSGSVSVTYNRVWSCYSNDTLRIVVRGNCHRAYINDVLVIEFFDSTGNDKTQHGIQITTTTDQIDNYLVCRA